MNATDYAAKQAATAFMVKQLRIANPHLVACGENESSLTAAAKNIRIELKRAFPSVKFAVRSSRFSMGDSITVSWIDGPTSDQVDVIINKYSAGSFDGMTDCYNYELSAWTDAFGDAKYVHSSRSYSDKMLETVINRVCRHLGGVDKVPTVEDYRQGRVWHLMSSGGVDIAHEIGRALSRHTYAVESVA